MLGEDLIGGGLSSEQTFVRLADAFASIEDPARRVQLAFKLFDSEGVALLQVLGDGAAAFEAARQQARDLGVVLDEHVIRSAVETKDQLQTMTSIIDTRLSEALIALSPVLVSAVEGMVSFAEAIGDVVARTQDLEDQSTRAIQRRVRQIAIDLKNATEGIKLTLSGFERVPIDLSRADPELRRQVQVLVEEQRLALEELASRELQKPTGDGGGLPSGGARTLTEAEKLLLELKKERLEVENQFVELQKLEFKQQLELINATITDKEARAEAAADLDRIFSARIAKAGEAERKLRDVTTQTEEFWEEIGSGIEDTFERAFSRMVTQGEFFLPLPRAVVPAALRRGSVPRVCHVPAARRLSG